MLLKIHKGIKLFLHCLFYKTSYPFIISFLLLMEIASGQCPDRIFFREKIKSIYRPKSKTAELQIKKFQYIRDQMKKCNLDRDSVYMFLMQKTGILYLDFKKLDSAVYFTNLAIDIAKGSTKNLENNSPSLVDCYYSMFYFYNESGDDYEKFQAADSCIKYFMTGSGDVHKTLVALIEKVEYLFNKGDYSGTAENSALGESIVSRQYHNKDSIDYIIYFSTIRANSMVYANKITEAFKLLQEKISGFSRNGFENSLAPIYNLLGVINRDKGKPEDAITWLMKSYKLFAANKFNNGCAQNLSMIGSILALQLNQAPEGLKYTNRAIRYPGIDWDVLFTLYSNKGVIYKNLKIFDSAQHYFQLAFNTIQKGSDETSLFQSSFMLTGFDELNNLFVLAKSKADTWLDEFYYSKNKSSLEKAIKTYKQIDFFLNKIRVEQRLQVESNLIWRNLAKSMYEKAIDACYADNNIEDAYYFFQKSRSVLLNDQINQLRWKADADINKEANLAGQIFKLKQKLKDSSGPFEDRILIQKNLYNLRTRYDEFINKIRSKNRLYYQMHLDTTSLPLSEVITKLLAKDKSLLEIFSGDSSVYIITATNQKKGFHKINKQAYAGLVKQFNAYLSDYNKLNTHFNDFKQTSYNLFKLIFPENNFLKGRVIISPDGVNFPFEALIMNTSGEPDYFLYHYTVSYTYSAKYLLNEFNVSNKEGSYFLGVAPITFPGEMNLTSLAGSDLSLKRIKNYFPGSENLISKDATKKTFLDNFSRYQIIQLYTHASDSSSQGDPVIYFSDSVLYLSTLLPETKSSTRLIVLSACLTAGGRYYDGEGVFSFNRQFASLDIPATISNLWSVEDESTYQITELFYRYLSKGLTTDEALQKAKIDFINSSNEKDKQLPYFWASLILTGKTESINGNTSSPLFETSAVVIVVLLIALILSRYLIFRKKHKKDNYPG